MMPQPFSTTIPRGNNLLARFLIAIDDSEHSARALRYVGTLLRDVRNAEVTLFHVLKPMPRELLEHGGSEDPKEETRLSEELRQEQAEWVRAESAIERPILATALALLEKTGFPQDRVTMKFGHADDIGHNILAEARTGSYGTIVLSRQGPNGMQRYLGGGVADQLLRGASGYTLWIVE